MALREAIDGIREITENNDLCQQMSRLVEYPNKIKRLQQLSKSEGKCQLGNTRLVEIKFIMVKIFAVNCLFCIWNHFKSIVINPFIDWFIRSPLDL